MTCQQVRRQLLAWVEGELDESQWLSFVRHMETCELCRAEAQRWQRLVATLRAIAQSDGIPPVPNRLWSRLRTNRRRLPAAVSLFVTACVAFFLGWGVRGIATPLAPPKISPVVRQGMDDGRREKARWQEGNHASTQRLGLSLFGETPLRVRLVIPSSVPKSVRPSPFTPSLPRYTPSLALRGATSVAFDIGQAQSFVPLSLPPRSLADLPTGEFALGNGEAVGQGEDASRFADEPFRIFVQVADPQGQVVRTVLIDRSEPNHVVAEWREIRQMQKPQTEVSDDALVSVDADAALPDRSDGGGAK